MLNFPTLISLISRIFTPSEFLLRDKMRIPVACNEEESVLICEICGSLRKYSNNRLAFSKESRIFAGVKI